MTTGSEKVGVEEQAAKPQRRTVKPLVLPESVTVKQLADAMKISPIDVIKQLMRGGVMAAINQAISFEVAELITPVFGYKARLKAKTESGQMLHELDKLDPPPSLLVRPPVVTILGHVDHGKTTLLDAIRKTNVAAGEVGGITQRIGAYQVEYKGQKITFLDTPGHEAFTAIRARGAKVTDMAVLVVAADDGVMPQTVEALDHAKAAGVPIIVAINKVDKPGADPERVKRQLAEHGLIFEEWGGDVIAVPVSAKQAIGIDDLLENIQVVAEVSELKANPQRPAVGTIVEAQLDKSRGPTATVLVQKGTLRVSDIIVAGSAWGRVKAMTNDRGKRMKDAAPSVPVEVLGFSSLPEPGDVMVVVSDEKTARGLAEKQASQRSQLDRTKALTLEEIQTRISTGEVKELNLIAKADVQGSLEAIRTSLEKLGTGPTKIRFLHTGSGTITESDILLASASKAIVIGFNTSVEPGAQKLADREGVQIRRYDIIYHLIEDVEKALKGILTPREVEAVVGKAEVRNVFPAGKLGKVAGCMILEGSITRGINIRVLRGGKAVAQTTVASLRRFKEDVNEVAAGYECGVGLDGFNDFLQGDIIEAFRTQRANS